MTNQPHTARVVVAISLVWTFFSMGCSTGARPTFPNAASVPAPVQHERTNAMPAATNEPQISEFRAQFDETDDVGCSNALYWADEPFAATMTPVSTEEAEKMCNERLITCFRQCMNNPKPPWPAQKKGDRSHHEHCNKKCNGAYRACLQKAGLLQTFAVMDAALAWIKSHGKEIVGTMVIIGGVAYIVSTGGSGALVLVVL